MVIAGGLRERLIADSVYHWIRNALVDLGWFNSGRPYVPITMRTESVPNDEQIPFNTIVISESSTTDNEGELGSNLGEITTIFYVDFYAENEALGKELIHDVRDAIKGRLPSIGYTQSALPVYDWRLATPTLLFTCDIQDVIVDQARDFPKPWQRHWWVCRFDVVDYYGA